MIFFGKCGYLFQFYGVNVIYIMWSWKIVERFRKQTQLTLNCWITLQTNWFKSVLIQINFDFWTHSKRPWIGDATTSSRVLWAKKAGWIAPFLAPFLPEIASPTFLFLWASEKPLPRSSHCCASYCRISLNECHRKLFRFCPLLVTFY